MPMYCENAIKNYIFEIIFDLLRNCSAHFYSSIEELYPRMMPENVMGEK